MIQENLPSWLPKEVVDAVEAANPGVETHAVQSNLGAIIFRFPNAKDIEEWHQLREKLEASGSSSRAADNKLASNIILYPDPKIAAGYLTKRPNLGGLVVASALAKVTGAAETEIPIPPELQARLDKAAADHPEVDIHPIQTSFGWMVVKTPTETILNRADSERRKRGALASSGILVKDCLVYPEATVWAEWAAKRPLLVGWVAAKIQEYATGYLDELSGFPEPSTTST